MKQKVILLGFNEINFEFIERYIKKGYLPNFKLFFTKYGYKKTTSENEYDLLEPWIQWVSIHTGMMYEEHKVFRLGDIIDRPELKQLWEIAEEKGLSVGAISPFNGRNNLKAPLFFVPDPWTQTQASGNGALLGLSRAVSKAVNNNANNKFGLSLMWDLLRGILSFVPLRKYFNYLSIVIFKLRRKSTKPVVLDNLLADVFISLWKKTTPDFSSLFLNSGAHIQHHYMFNSIVYKGDQKNPEWYCPSAQDPLLDILTEYDRILKELMNLNCRLFLATGLHQEPHDKNTFYWRLKDHSNFLNRICPQGITSVIPRMSRDFLIECENEAAAKSVQSVIENVYSEKDNERIFSVDNRGKSLFIELVYPHDVKQNFMLRINKAVSDIDLSKYVSFVALKNGEHHNVGYFADTEQIQSPEESTLLKNVFIQIKESFA